jgi:hypothetical protein
MPSVFTRATGSLCRLWGSYLLWWVLTGSLALNLVAVYSLGSPPLPIIQPDSTSYWIMHTGATLGYPAVIRGLYALTGTLKSIVVLQIVLFCAAVLTLQAGFAALTRSAATAGILALLLLGYSGLSYYALALLSDELFVALIIFHIAAAAFALARDSKMALAMMALTAVLAVSIRPAGYFLCGGVIVLALAWAGHRWLVARWAVVPLLVFLGMFVAVGLAARGIPTQRFTGIYMFPHVAHLYDGGGCISSETERDLLQALAPFHDDRNRQTDWVDLADYERLNYLPIVRASLAALHKTTGADKENDIMMSLALHTILAHPREYAQLVARATVRGFQLKALDAPRLDAAGIRYQYEAPARVAARRDLEQAMQTRFDFQPSDYSNYLLMARYPVPQIAMLRAGRAFFLPWAIIAVTVCWSLVLFGAPGREVLFTAYTGALVLGAYMQIAMSVAIIDRYAWPIDALIIVIIVMGAWLVFDAAKRLGFMAHSEKPRTFFYKKLGKKFMRLVLPFGIAARAW